MHIPVRGLTIAAALTTAGVLVLPPISHEPNAGFAARAQESAKDKMTTAGKTAQQVKELLIKLPDDPPKQNGKAGARGSTTVQSGRLKTNALSKTPCSDPECGGENRAKAGAAAR